MYKPVGEKCLEEILSVVENEKKVKKVISSYSKTALNRARELCSDMHKALFVKQQETFDERREDKILQLQKCDLIINKELNYKEFNSKMKKVKQEVEPKTIKTTEETFKKGKKYRIKTWDELLEDDKNSIDATGDITNNENGACFVKSMKKISNTIFETDENKERFLVLGWQVEPWMCEKVESIALEETSKSERTEREFENPNAEYVSTDLESVEPGEKEISTVNHPQHYNVGSIETIDVIEGLGWGQGFNLGNALKYLMRCEHKGKKKEDLEKAMWYIKRELENLEEEK